MKGISIHKESLLQLHPLMHLFTDNCITIRKRAIDARWHYNDEFPEIINGFNPLKSTVYIARHSYLEEWLDNKEKCVREYNPPSNKLITEVLFLVHDYLHIWAFNWIRKLAPKLKVGEKAISKANIEEFVFCHLITEAVATVGLDYWYMCAVDTDKICPAGVNFEGLTVSYKLGYEGEYQKFYPGFEAQTPEFFEKIAAFYCTGEFTGFGKADLYRSPVVYQWLSHELTYGENQRVFIRQWYSYLSDDNIRYTDKELKSKVDVSQPWKKRLIKEVGRLLWDKIKNDKTNSPGLNIDPEHCWKSSKRSVDYRFTNYNAIKKTTPGYKGNRNDSENFKYWLNQFLAQHDYGEIDDEIFRILDFLKGKREPKLIQYLFKNQERLCQEKGEPKDLFLLN